MAAMPLGPHHHQPPQQAPLPLPLPLPPPQLQQQQQQQTLNEPMKTTAVSGVSDMNTDKVNFHLSL
jgi:hypothetical protein